ncbi:MAG TPA: tetratricopeptide repeat protein [Oligoflexus sp.]|uniref:tetratricopeptide repeat protein n=1 Tax=Oligoflexus sp. TaxID=1971216 RepID=UPI002D81116B|nr:tetratricopeptide repeat protein [Oligoflexus sp.]HET9237405.1 tetratricopeptide repeat protein [Oligoflexus sp.]
MAQGRPQHGLSLFLRLLTGVSILAAFFLRTPPLHAALPPDLFQLWEQTYNEPDETLLTVKALLRSQPEGLEDERTAILYAIGAEAASFAENVAEHKKLAEAALTIAEKHRYMWPWVHAVSALAIYYEYDGKAVEATAHYEKSIQLAEDSKDPELLAFACNNLGYYFARGDKPKESIEVISRALRAIQGRPEGVLYHDIINNLALVYTRNEFVGRSDEGRLMLDKSIAYFKSRGMRYMVGNNYINLAFFHNRRGEHQLAIDTFLEAIAASRRSKKTDLLPYYLGQLADTYNSAKRYQEALKPNEESCVLFKQMKNTIMSGACLLTRATTLVRLNRPQEALEALQERSKLLDIDPNSEYELELEVETEAWHQLGNVKKELETARRWIKASKRIYNRNNSKTLQQIAGVLELERKDAENKLLEEKDRTSTMRLAEAERMSRILIGLLGVSLVLVGFMLHSVRQARVIRSQRDRMQEVLDNIEEGILRFGKDFKIRKEYSAHVSQILDISGELTGQDLFSMLFKDSELSADAQATVRAALANVFDEDEISWSFNSHQLPFELHRRNRILNLLWQPHYGSHGLDKVLLVIRDVTAHKKLEAEVEASQKTSETITRCMRELLEANARPLQRFMPHIEDELKELTERLREPSGSAAALRQLHTIKGNARSLGLMALAEAVHQVESAHKRQSELTEVSSRLLAVGSQYAKLYQAMFQGQQHASMSLLSMVDTVQIGLLNQLKERKVPFGSITVTDEVGLWPEAWQDSLQTLLLHALSNAVDHGYGQVDPSEAVRLQVEALHAPDGVRLCIRDRGRGISWDKLKKLAHERQFQPEPGRPLSDLLFLDGITTTEKLSLMSGRGVGLAAVKDACQKLGATVTLCDNDEGRGTMLVVDIPAGAQALSA